MPDALLARVLGAGPSGALAALALARAGWQVQLCDPLPAAALLERNRAYAFTHSTRRLWQRLGLWDALEPRLTPFDHLQLLDQGSGGEALFRAADLPERTGRDGAPSNPVGWIGRHRPLMTLLLAELQNLPAVELRLGQPPTVRPSSEAAPQLVVAADGPQGSSRRDLAIGQWQWTYRQACLTAEVELRGTDPHQAWEVLRPEGPFALLPLGDGLFQLVWSAPAERCRQLEQLDPSAFLEQLAAALPAPLEVDGLRDQPRAFPVSLQLAHRLQRGRTLLLGESGHRCHPVGGQGLNLCWRDVAVLHRLACRCRAGRLAVSRLGATYARRRWLDLLFTLVATDALVRLFSNRQPLLLPLRRLVLAALSHWPWSRRWVLAVMTDGLVPGG